MGGISFSADPDGLLEYSVVYTDRSLNHMSRSFQGVMRDISSTLKSVYSAHSVAIVPGSGTFGMEAVARQFAGGRKCMVIRNGWFSYRWTQIFEAGGIPSACPVLKARRTEEGREAAFAPAPIEEVVAAIHAEQPAVVFAPHVETSSGIMLPDDYLHAVADAVHSVDGIFVLDCVASGAIWVDMEATGVDVLISAPQKGWSSPACCALIMLSRKARDLVETTRSTSFSCDLKKWLQIMAAYENGSHAYHTTMPTDGLARFRDVIKETERFGFEKARKRQLELGRRVRRELVERGFRSVAAKGYQAPCVVVSYTTDAGIQSGDKFVVRGLQIAAGGPLACDEPDDFRTFRIGLFGLDKLQDTEGTLNNFRKALNAILLDYWHI